MVLHGRQEELCVPQYSFNVQNITITKSKVRGMLYMYLCGLHGCLRWHYDVDSATKKKCTGPRRLMYLFKFTSTYVPEVDNAILHATPLVHGFTKPRGRSMGFHGFVQMQGRLLHLD